MISAKIAVALVLGAFGLGMVPSCASTEASGGTDSNTHWLEQCQTDKDCGSLVCRCGACTKPCAETAACGVFGANASCAAEVCDTGAKACVAPCNTAADCPHGGGGFECAGGRCAATAGPTGGPCPATLELGGSCRPRDRCGDLCAGEERFVCGDDGRWTQNRALVPCDGGIANPSGGTCVPGTASQDTCYGDAQCWTPCSNGYRSHFVCNGEKWVAGHGLFPCSADAGSSVGTDGICPARVTSGASCGAGDDQCWTMCTNDLRSQFVCSGGQWLAGKGLFPCGTVDSGPPGPISDAAPPPADAGSCLPMDAHTGSLPCIGTVGYAWDGSGCSPIECSCEGKDCGSIYPTALACRVAWNHCLLKEPVRTSCRSGADCLITSRACCSACGDPQVSDTIALNVNSQPAWRQTFGIECQETQCPCASPPAGSGTVDALCEAGTCTAVNLAQYKECLKDDECIVRTKDCCQCGGTVNDLYAMVAVNGSFSQSYSALVCPSGAANCEGCQAPQFIPEVHARCDLTGGYCYLSPK